MTIWVDAQFSPAIAAWLAETFSLDAHNLQSLGLRDAEDEEIFHAARAAHAIVMTKDADFPALLARNGPPSQIIWITCGNTSNARLKQILAATLPQTLSFLASGEPLVEIGDA